jgi:hypothetical protein
MNQISRNFSLDSKDEKYQELVSTVWIEMVWLIFLLLIMNFTLFNLLILIELGGFSPKLEHI